MNRTGLDWDNTDWYAQAHRFVHPAMAATFEIYIANEDAAYAGQAAGAAFDELDRLERDLSRFIENSDISRINQASPGETIRVGLDAFACLTRCKVLCDETGGAFDPAIGTLLDCWKNSARSSRILSSDELAYARENSGMHRLELDKIRHAVCKRAFVQIDLGGFGKGYALDRMAAMLCEWDIGRALLHGGWSTVLALNGPTDDGWPVSIRHPESGETLRRFSLLNQALSGSGLRKGPHIFDPRTTEPIRDFRAAWSLAPTAADADALSTAFLVMTGEEAEAYCRKHPGSGGVRLTGKEPAYDFGDRILPL